LIASLAITIHARRSLLPHPRHFDDLAPARGLGGEHGAELGGAAVSALSKYPRAIKMLVPESW
jgi:hypothetical protein